MPGMDVSMMCPPYWISWVMALPFSSRQMAPAWEERVPCACAGGGGGERQTSGRTRGAQSAAAALTVVREELLPADDHHRVLAAHDQRHATLLLFRSRRGESKHRKEQSGEHVGLKSAIFLTQSVGVICVLCPSW